MKFDLFGVLGRVGLGWCEGPERQRSTSFLGPGGSLAVGLAALLVRTEELLAMSGTVGS